MRHITNQLDAFMANPDIAPFFEATTDETALSGSLAAVECRILREVL